MPQSLIFWPMCAVVALTFGALALVPVRRFRAGFAGKVTDADFRFGESARVPGDVSIPNRNYMNLLEMPVLFHLACVVLYLRGAADGLALTLAWVYVALRAAHSAIHLTYNNVYHRLTAFAASNFFVLGLWALIVVSLVRNP
ncbi:MAG TPA: MAPEG family protein [Rhizomicrobium sp.]|nr:MAPEG family protein [Rhizomicrobium sp.]